MKITILSGQEFAFVFHACIGYLMELNYPMVQQITTSADLIEYQLNIIDLESGRRSIRRPLLPAIND